MPMVDEGEDATDTGRNIDQPSICRRCWQGPTVLHAYRARWKGGHLN